MKRATGRAAALSAVLLIAYAPPAHGFVTIGVKWAARRTTFRINPNFPDTTLAGSTDQQIEIIQCASRAWRDQSRADFQFNYSGTTTKSGFNEQDGVNVVSFVPTDGNEALAATLVSGDNGVASSFDVVFFGKTLNTANKWSGPGEPDSGEMDIGGVATHELGHALGLGHSPIAAATMFASASGRALGLRTLHSDDRDGVESLYGTRTQEEPTVQVTSVTPDNGPTVGGNEVVVEGVNFTYDSESQLFVAGTALAGTRWDVESCSRIRIHNMPGHGTGPVDIRVTNSIGSGTGVGLYRYGGPSPRLTAVDPDAGPITGGIEVVVTGENFVEGAVVTIGGRPLESLQVQSSGVISGILPPGVAAGTVDVELIEGLDHAMLADAFTYNPYSLKVGSVSAPQGGRSVPVEVRTTSPEDLSSVSFGIVYDASVFAVTGIATAGTTSADAAFVGKNIDNAAGVTTVGIVMSFSDTTPFIPAGTDVLLCKVVGDVHAAAEVGTEVPLQLRDRVGSPQIDLIFTRTGDATRLLPFTQDGTLTVTKGVTFLRGDSNGDKRRDISDAVHLLDFLFKGGPAPPCADAADANDDGTRDISDAVTILALLFQGLAELPAPFPEEGFDPTPDTLDCAG